MAQRTLRSIRSALRSLQPTMRCSCAAESPRLSFAQSHMARNQARSGRWVRSIMVPAVTLNWCEHLVHCHLCARPLTLEQVVQPHLGQTKPPGKASPSSLLSHDPSSGYRSMKPMSVPLDPSSALASLPLFSPLDIVRLQVSASGSSGLTYACARTSIAATMP